MHARMMAVPAVLLLATGCETAGSSTAGIPPTQLLLESYSAVPEAMLLDPPPGEWLMWRRTYDHWGHSPLAQIDRTNVAGLELSWSRPMEPGKQEATPLVHDGVMFLPQACDFVEAVDARDGTVLWTYRRDRVEHAAIHACANRNAALFGERLYLATHDAHLVALDARSGAVVWDRRVGDWTLGQHYSGGPQIIAGRVVAGMSGCYHINSRCWVSAHDPDTGEEMWRTHTIALSDEPGGDTWGDVPDERRLGGSAWIAPSYDPDLGLIYIGAAVPVPWGSVQRGSGDGDVLYTNSTLALDAETGEIQWYFQHLPGDEWDQDHPFERILVETGVSPEATSVEWINPAVTAGERRKVVTGVPGKPGIVWTLDARTGEFLWARGTSYQNVIVGVDVQKRQGISNPELEAPAIGEEVVVCPDLRGGINWQAVAYSPHTNALYVPGNNTCMRYTLNDVDPMPGDHHRSASFPRIHVPGSDERVGQLTAIDVETGSTLWEIRQRAGFGGSVLTTAGGLVFASDDARRLRAFDAATGDVLWEYAVGSTVGGFPVTYSVDGVQYLAVPAGGGPTYVGLTPELQGRGAENRLLVFRLP